MSGVAATYGDKCPMCGKNGLITIKSTWSTSLKCFECGHNSINKVIEKRPWGSYEILAEGVGYKTKRIIIHPLQEISLQSHNHREEAWVIVDGIGEFDRGVLPTLYYPGQIIINKAGAKHRIKNYSENKDLIFIETQTGLLLEEDDIIRYEDIYGRN